MSAPVIVKPGEAGKPAPSGSFRVPAAALQWFAQTRTRRLALAATWHRHLGRPAWIALGLFAALALLQWQLRPLLVRESHKLHDRQLRLAQIPVGQRAVDANAQLDAPALAGLPTAQQRGRDLEIVISAAERNGLVLERADYALGAATQGTATRLDATLPLTGSYGALRSFVAQVLNDLPHSALESLQIERPTTQSAQVQATAHLVLFYREEVR